MGAQDAGPAGEAGIRVRRAAPSDARAIAKVAVAGWKTAYRGLLPDAFLDSLRVESREAAWHEMLVRDVDGGLPAWVAESGGQVVGFVSTGPPRDEDVSPPAVELYAIYVLPPAWRHGTGRTLIRTATDHWLKDGPRTFVLWVLEGNERARAFYEAMGWRPDGGRQGLEIGGATAIEVRYRLSPA